MFGLTDVHFAFKFWFQSAAFQPFQARKGTPSSRSRCSLCLHGAGLACLAAPPAAVCAFAALAALAAPPASVCPCPAPPCRVISSPRVGSPLRAPIAECPMLGQLCTGAHVHEHGTFVVRAYWNLSGRTKGSMKCSQ